MGGGRGQTELPLLVPEASMVLLLDLGEWAPCSGHILPAPSQ